VVLTFEPGPEFKKGGGRPSTTAALLARLPESKLPLLFVVLAGLALVIPGLVIPAFTRVFIDDYLVHHYTTWIKPLLLGMGITAVARFWLTRLQQRYLVRLETMLSITMSEQFFRHVLRLPIAYFSQRYAGDISSRVSLNDRVAALLSGQLATTVLNLITVVFYAALMFYYDPLLTVIGIAIALVNVAALRYFARMRKDESRRLSVEQAKLVGTSVRGLQSIETLKAMGGESDFFAKWAGYQAKVVNAQQGLGFKTKLLGSFPPLLTALNSAAILGIGSVRVMNGQMTIGLLVAFQSLMASFTEPVNQLVSLGSTLQEMEADLTKLDDVLANPADSPAAVASDPAIPRKLDGLVELRNVTFGYSRLEPPLIENFNLTIPPGQRVALVGASGSGKSTVSRIVCGLFQPWEGEVLFDRERHDAIPRETLTNSLALVDQDIFLFEGSIRDNLTLWDSTVAETSIIEAGKDACIHDDLTVRSGGYDARVEEGGRNFSGGQRQRLEIARALVGDPTVLVLDEATSALDPRTEKAVDQNVRRRGCTVLVIAHRLSTIRDCDEIIVLDRGKVVQRGTHEQMRSVDGPYSRLIAME